MKMLLRIASTAALVLLLAGCYETLPTIQSANLTRWQENNPQGQVRPLTAEQTAKLSAWLQDHHWGWYPVTATYRPEVVVWVTHADGTMTPIRLMKNVLTVGKSQRSLSEAESQALHAMLGFPWGKQ